MITCEKILGKRNFESYSEFYLAMCIAAEMGRRGEQLDMSSMVVDRELLSKDEIDYFNYLKSNGIIYLNGVDYSKLKKETPEGVKYYMDMSMITNLQGKLYNEDEEHFLWSPEIMYENTKDAPWYMRVISNTGNILMHISAYLIVGQYLGEIKKKKFVVSFDGFKAKNTYFYVNLYSCMQTIDWFKDFIELDIDFSGVNVDIQYSLFCNNSQVTGHYKKYTLSEKKELLKKFNILEGAIVVLWTRHSFNPANVIGKISHAIIARIDEVGEDFLGVTTLALNKTIEENREDYFSISDDKRYLFSDMLNYRPAQTIQTLSLYDLGIMDYMHDETSFITLLDKRETVVKRVTIDGEESNVSMSGIDAIYWLLSQYSIEFDRDMYRAMYSGGKSLMWDEYGE